jgi:hypothetical protein
MSGKLLIFAAELGRASKAMFDRDFIAAQREAQPGRINPVGSPAFRSRRGARGAT